MDNSFSIKSSCSDRELVFESHEGDYYTVSLRGSDISAVRRVWGYTDTEFLVEIFDSLAKQTQAWATPVNWSSIESDFELEFKCNKQGHVFVDVIIRSFSGGEEWKAQAVIQTELGLLPQIANNASWFFDV
jgi:hypothetical protein